MKSKLAAGCLGFIIGASKIVPDIGFLVVQTLFG